MNKFMVTISCDKQTCIACGRKGKGHFEHPKAPGKYVCMKCVQKRIKKMPKPVPAKQPEATEV